LIFPAYFVEGMARMGHGPRVSPLIIAGGLVGGIGMPFVLARVAEVMGPNGLFLLLAGLASATAVVALIVLMQRSGARTATP
jgi:fucose permease